MSEDPKLPTSWWRRAVRSVDGIDILAACSSLILAVGLFILFGLGVMLTVAGTLGLCCVAMSIVGQRVDKGRRR